MLGTLAIYLVQRVIMSFLLGEGVHHDYLRRLFIQLEYHGTDLENSPFDISESVGHNGQRWVV